jgi:hypothetical protein
MHTWRAGCAERCTSGFGKGWLETSLEEATRRPPTSLLRGEDFAEVVVTPARFEPPGFDATLGGLLLFEQIERHLSQDDKVLLTVVGCRIRLASS